MNLKIFTLVSRLYGQPLDIRTFTSEEDLSAAAAQWIWDNFTPDANVSTWYADWLDYSNQNPALVQDCELYLAVTSVEVPRVYTEDVTLVIKNVTHFGDIGDELKARVSAMTADQLKWAIP